MAEVQKKRFLKKAGRTLVVKTKSGTLEESLMKQLKSLNGLQSHSVSESKVVFLTFDSVDNSKDAMRVLRKDHGDSVRTKYSHYKVFFKLDGMTEEAKYDDVKTQHKQWVESHTGSDVLYYKLYRKDGAFLSCGDLTVDTKEGLDLLLSPDKHKTFKLDSGLSGTFYRYRKNENSKVEVD